MPECVKMYLGSVYAHIIVWFNSLMSKNANRKKDGVVTVQGSSDWHKADIKAALDKAGWSLRQLSLYHGLHEGCMRVALARPYPKAERIIANVIGEKPESIWPSRYDSSGKPNRRGGKKPKRPAHLMNDTNKPANRN